MDWRLLGPRDGGGGCFSHGRNKEMEKMKKIRNPVVLVTVGQKRIWRGGCERQRKQTRGLGSSVGSVRSFDVTVMNRFHSLV